MSSRILAIFIAAAASFGLTFGAHAANVIGSSGLLNSTNANQIESWLGQGSVEFDNAFTKVSGSTSNNFHAAADGKGATISILSVVYGNGVQALIGGYDPSSWYSQSSYKMSNAGGAFLFNLTSGLLQQQKAQNNYQTYNSISYGPTFGGGHDIYINSNLNSGYVNGYSYGVGPNILGSSGVENITVLGLEVYTISPYQVATVPEPETYAMLLAGLGFIGSVVRRRKRKIVVT